MIMLIVKSQFSKYEVVENVYSFETAQSRVNVYAEAEFIDGISPSNIVQRSGRSGRSGHSLSSISLFIHLIRGSDPYASNVDVSMERGPTPRIHCDTDDGHDLPPFPLGSRRTSKDKGTGQDHITPLNSSHKWLLEETDGQGEDVGSHKETNERRLSWEDSRILMPAVSDHHDPKSSYVGSTPPLHKTLYPQLNGDEKSGDDDVLMHNEQVMSEEGSENLGESPDVFGFNLPNHRPRPGFHTHSQGPLSSLSQSEAVSGDLESGCGELASRQRPQGRLSQQQQYQGQQPYVSQGNHQVNQQRQTHDHHRKMIESKSQSQSTPSPSQSSPSQSSPTQSSPSQSSPTQSSPSPQLGSSDGNAQSNNDIDINHQNGDQDIDEDILTLLSSISLSEARKYHHHHGKRSARNNPRPVQAPASSRYDSSGVPRYRLLVIDDR